jgi:quercetin dioxygenase-like cupin family protein
MSDDVRRPRLMPPEQPDRDLQASETSTDAESAMWTFAPAALPSPGLWERIEAATHDDVVARGDAIAWDAWAPGIARRILARDRSGEARCFMLRLDPGAEIPAHDHDRDEECLVIAGDLLSRSGRLGPGDFILARAGSRHPPMQSVGGGLLYVSLRGD